MKHYNKKWEIFYQTWIPFDEELNQYMEQKRLESYKQQVKLKRKKIRKPQPIRDNMNDKSKLKPIICKQGGESPPISKSGNPSLYV